MKKDPTVPTPPVPDPLDRLLRQTLADARPGSGGAHVEAERLAAWAAKSLPAAESLEIDQHLSTCDRCQAMLAVFSRIDTTPAPTASPWQRRWVAWVIPATAVAAATLAWIAWPGPPPAIVPDANAVVAQAEPQNRVVVAPEPEIGRVQTELQAVQQGQQGQQGQKGELTKLADARQENRADPTPPKPAAPPPVATEVPPPARPQAAPPPPPPPALPPPPPPPVTATGAAPPAQTRTAMAESVQSSVIYTLLLRTRARRTHRPRAASLEVWLAVLVAAAVADVAVAVQ